MCKATCLGDVESNVRLSHLPLGRLVHQRTEQRQPKPKSARVLSDRVCCCSESGARAAVRVNERGRFDWTTVSALVELAAAAVFHHKHEVVDGLQGMNGESIGSTAHAVEWPE